MSPQQPATRRTQQAAAYRSTACRVGSHDQCTHAEPKAPPVGVPVVYDACSCRCHSSEKR